MKKININNGMVKIFFVTVFFLFILFLVAALIKDDHVNDGGNELSFNKEIFKNYVHKDELIELKNIVSNMSDRLSSIQGISTELNEKLMFYLEQLKNIESLMKAKESNFQGLESRVSNLSRSINHMEENMQAVIQTLKSNEEENAMEHDPIVEVVSIDLWGNEYLANIKYQGSHQAISVGEKVDNWLLVEINFGAKTVIFEHIHSGDQVEIKVHRNKSKS